jgi:hypothetical protein
MENNPSKKVGQKSRVTRPRAQVAGRAVRKKAPLAPEAVIEFVAEAPPMPILEAPPMPIPGAPLAPMSEAPPAAGLSGLARTPEPPRALHMSWLGSPADAFRGLVIRVRRDLLTSRFVRRLGPELAGWRRRVAPLLARVPWLARRLAR